MKKLLAALITAAFATVGFAQMKDEKKAGDTKPYGNTPTENKTAAPAMKDDKMMKKDAPAAKMTKEEKKAARKAKSAARAEKTKEELKQDVKKP